MLQPVINKIKSHKIFSAARRSTGANSSRGESAKDLINRSGKQKGKFFRRLNESESIGNDEENMFSMRDIESPNPTSEKNGRSRSVVTTKKSIGDTREQIEITTAWSVNSRLHRNGNSD